MIKLFKTVVIRLKDNKVIKAMASLKDSDTPLSLVDDSTSAAKK